MVLHELSQPVEIIDKRKVTNFSDINPVGTVPVLVDNNVERREGAAVLLYLLDKHPNTMLPASGRAREQATQDIMFANTTMHPAYGHLFFTAQNIFNEAVKQKTFEAAALAIGKLWQVVEQQLAKQDFLGGYTPSAADIMLAVYSRWGAHFPVNIPLGPKTKKMVDAVVSMPSFRHSLSAEEIHSAA